MSDPSAGSMPILPTNWEALSPLIDAVLDSPPDRREALILQVTGGDAARADALRKLVSECERGLPLLDRSAGERFGALAADDRSLLPPLVADRYRIGRELGRGGMARVYLAHDVKHGRDVAIKVLRPELSQSLGHDRFLREIEIAARLRHPNIVPLYDSGEVDGALYFVMPYEEGRSLRERLRAEGALPVSDALGVLRDVARALAYAHEHGVVHRDVKSDNVMLSSDAAIVTDFGIAKAVSAALTDGGTELTQTGSAIGTPAYMAPEQAAGDPGTDHRADIYAFGCLAFEVFTGNPPFHGLSKHQTIAAHLMTAPPAVGTIRSDVPAPVADLIARCLEKDPGSRPQAAREVLRALDAPVTPSGSWTAPAPATTRRSRKSLPIGLALVVVLALGAYLLTGSRGSARPISLAVLPFGYDAADTAMSFVADGLPDEVAGALSRVPGIEIRSRSGARLYRRQLSVDVTDAGTKLNAEYVMHGVIRQERGRWIVSMDLARAADQTSIWGETFDISPDEAAGSRDAIAASVIAALQRRFPAAVGAAPALASNQRTTSDEAYRLYLRGQERLSRRGQSVREGADLFRAAIREDSLYAGAWSGLSMALVLFPHFQGVPTREIRDEVIRAAGRALELDSTLAQPHTALGLLHQFEHQWDEAEAEHMTALRLDERNVEARLQHARHLMMRGRPGEALGQLRTAKVEDPASAVVLSITAYAYYLDGQLDSALAEARRALENDSTNLTAVGLGANIHLANGRQEEAVRLLSRFGNLSNYPALRYVLARSGNAAEAIRRQREEDAVEPQPWMSETRRALTYVGLGDTATALSALERATAAGEIWTSNILVSDPIWATIRDSPRYRNLVRRIGLADALPPLSR
jgi:TolB-like protein/tRNA A-37 threonylcarbamoyl transferase component Bud32/Flp pilus assembly protein TadD